MSTNTFEVAISLLCGHVHYTVAHTLVASHELTIRDGEPFYDGMPLCRPRGES